MKIFKYKFTRLISLLIYFCLALCAVGFALNLYLCLTVGIGSAADPVYPIIQYSAMFFISVVLAVLLVSILLSSKYVVGDKKLKICFGLIKSTYSIDDMESIELDRETDKLSVYFKDGTYIVIVVKQEWYNDFIEAILNVNPRIEYTIKSKQGKTDDKDKKD